MKMADENQAVTSAPVDGGSAGATVPTGTEAERSDASFYDELAVEIPEEGEVQSTIAASQPAEAPPAPVETRTPASQAPPQTAQVPQAPAPQTAQPAVAGVQAPPSGITTEELLQRRQAWADQLAQQYQIPEADIDVLATEPHKVLPQLAANIVVNTYEAVVQYLNHAMPHLIGTMMHQANVYRSETERFFQAWPELRESKDPRLGQTVTWIAQGYRKMNPTASVDQAIQDIGRQAIAALNIPAKANGQGAQRGGSPRPFTHAAPGVAAGPPAPEQRGVPGEKNFFTELANIDLSEL